MLGDALNRDVKGVPSTIHTASQPSVTITRNSQLVAFPMKPPFDDASMPMSPSANLNASRSLSLGTLGCAANSSNQLTCCRVVIPHRHLNSAPPHDLC